MRAHPHILTATPKMATLHSTILLVVLLFIPPAVNGDLIHGHDETVLVKEGEPFNLTCLATIVHKANNGVQLKHGVNTIFQSYPPDWYTLHFNREKYTFKQPSNNEYQLTVKSAETTDVGKYTCDMTSGHGHRKSFLVFVFDSPEILLSKQQEGEIIEGVFKIRASYVEDPPTDLRIGAYIQGSDKDLSIGDILQVGEGPQMIQKNLRFVGHRSMDKKRLFFLLGSQNSTSKLEYDIALNIKYNEEPPFPPAVHAVEASEKTSKLRIVPMKETYKVSEVIHCFIGDDPTAAVFEEYEWVSDEQFTIKGNRLVTHENMTGLQSWKCIYQKDSHHVEHIFTIDNVCGIPRIYWWCITQASIFAWLFCLYLIIKGFYRLVMPVLPKMECLEWFIGKPADETCDCWYTWKLITRWFGYLTIIPGTGIIGYTTAVILTKYETEGFDLTELQGNQCLTGICLVSAGIIFFSVEDILTQINVKEINPPPLYVRIAWISFIIVERLVVVIGLCMTQSIPLQVNEEFDGSTMTLTFFLGFQVAIFGEVLILLTDAFRKCRKMYKENQAKHKPMHEEERQVLEENESVTEGAEGPQTE